MALSCRFLVLRHGNLIEPGRKLAQSVRNAGPGHGLAMSWRNNCRIQTGQPLYRCACLVPILGEVGRRTMQLRLLGDGCFKERFRLGGTEGVSGQQNTVFPPEKRHMSGCMSWGMDEFPSGKLRHSGERFTLRQRT